MKEESWISFQQLGDALKKLEQAVKKPDDEEHMYRNATIQRFEFTIELFWKVLKKLLLREKIIVTTPRETLQKAYAINWIANEKLWLRMMDDRNLTSHTYKEENAEIIYDNIKEYFPAMKESYLLLQEKFRSNF